MLIFLLNINKSMVCLEPLIFYFADEDGGDIPSDFYIDFKCTSDEVTLM